MTTQAEQLIAESIAQTKIVHAKWDHAVQTDLIVACDDWTEADDQTTEYWGTDEDGNEWRVHLTSAESDDEDTHTHEVARESEPYGYRGSVSRDENRAAHGGICVTQYCRCGAERKQNSNGRHVETGEWYMPDE